MFNQKRISYQKFFLKGIKGYTSEENNEILSLILSKINKEKLEYNIQCIGKGYYQGFINSTNNIKSIEQIYDMRNRLIGYKQNINCNGPYNYILFKLKEKINIISNKNIIIDYKENNGIWLFSNIKIYY